MVFAGILNSNRNGVSELLNHITNIYVIIFKYNLFFFHVHSLSFPGKPASSFGNLSTIRFIQQKETSQSPDGLKPSVKCEDKQEQLAQRHFIHEKWGRTVLFTHNCQHYQHPHCQTEITIQSIPFFSCKNIGNIFKLAAACKTAFIIKYNGSSWWDILLVMCVSSILMQLLLVCGGTGDAITVYATACIEMLHGTIISDHFRK